MPIVNNVSISTANCTELHFTVSRKIGQPLPTSTTYVETKQRNRLRLSIYRCGRVPCVLHGEFPFCDNEPEEPQESGSRSSLNLFTFTRWQPHMVACYLSMAEIFGKEAKNVIRRLRPGIPSSFGGSRGGYLPRGPMRCGQAVLFRCIDLTARNKAAEATISSKMIGQRSRTGLMPQVSEAGWQSVRSGSLKAADDFAQHVGSEVPQGARAGDDQKQRQERRSKPRRLFIY